MVTKVIWNNNFKMTPLFKNALLLTFLLLNTVLNAQDTLAKVKNGREKADEDWANGTAKYYFWGLRNYNKLEIIYKDSKC